MTCHNDYNSHCNTVKKMGRCPYSVEYLGVNAMSIAYIKIFQPAPNKLVKQIEHNQTALMFTNIWLPLLSNAWRITLPHVLEANVLVAKLLDLADGKCAEVMRYFRDKHLITCIDPPDCS